jgi:glutamyl-tRNA synthetase
MDKVRVRFAPSPTGYLHIGGARTALYNYLFARHHQGVLILRIEDTDQVRSTSESSQAIVESLKWLGIDWDEGIFYQSERRALYLEHAQRLLDKGLAVYEDDPAKGRAIVFKMKPDIKIKFRDLIHGMIEFDSNHVGDIVLIKSDGFPAYNFACVVDDSLMEVTHIIRGDDHVSNTPKQIALYEALDKPIPQFAHLPLIMGEDGSRLSKRHGHTSVTEYRDLGYTPEALFNFLSLLGWSPGDDTEIMSRSDIIQRFTIERVKHAPAQFNLKKLTWLNSHYIKTMDLNNLVDLVKPFLIKANYDLSKVPEAQVIKLISLYRERARTIAEFVDATRFYFNEEVTYQPEAVQKHLALPKGKMVLTEVLNGLNGLPAFDLTNLETLLRALSEKHTLKFQEIAQPIRVAITGTTVSPGIFETMELLGKEKVVTRIQNALTHI